MKANNTGISIKRTTLVITAVALLISVLLILATFDTNARYSEVHATTDRYIQWQKDASALQAGSDYLTEQARGFAETGDRVYLDNYFTEAEETRRRDHAVARIHDYVGDAPAYRALAAAMEESLALMDREYYSMRLKIDACAYDVDDYPEALRKVTLSETDAALSPEEKNALARSKVFDLDYRGKKEAISAAVQECLASLEANFEGQRTQTAERLNRLLLIQRILIAFSIAITVLTLVLILQVIVRPLNRSVHSIREEKQFPVRGAKELQFVAETYNTMYENSQEQKQSMDALLNNMPAMSFTKDAETGVYLACNQAFADYAHVKSPEDVIGQTDAQIFHPEAAAHFAERDRKALSMDEPLVYSEDVAERDGVMRHFQTTKLKFVDPAGRLCVLGICMDVTDTLAKTQADAMITAMAADYRCVYYVNLDENDGVCYRDDPTDPSQTPVGIHFPFQERIAWYAENCVTDLYREGFLDFADPDNIRERLSTQPIIAYRYLAKRGDREYYEMIRAAGVRRAEERDDHMVHAIGLGLTRIDAEMRETMAKNEALAEALAMAEEANVAKTAFLSNMSHEIRTPMNAILGLNKLALHDESLTEQTRGYLEKTGDSARHLLALINDILDMSRIESGRIVLRREEFSFSGMLEQINTMVMSQCEDKGLHYECSLLSPVNDYYIGDDMKLKEVLINILSNAVKFTDPGGSISLTVERTAEYEDQSTLCFRIRDTGIGMDKSYIPKIFDAFSQEDSTRKNKYGSTGLGMAITKSIVEMMNGTISVESEKGAGTEFTVVIPLRNSLRTGSAEENAIDPGSLRVLIVDDEEIVAEHGRLVLDEAGIRADVCHSGAEALNMLELQSLKQEPYNLVLMDWRMPEMDGVETTRQIRQKYGSEDLAIIMTAYTWDTIREEALAAGVDGFLAKPLFASSVVEEFEHIVRRNQADMFKEKHLASLEGRRILMAEDMEINAEIMMDILSLQDAEADHAENGKIAVEMFEKSEPGTYAAILMDIRMPVMDGLEAAATIRALNRPDAKRIPIIALTANAFDEDVQRSLQAGMNAHLTKPVDADHLFQTLEELIYEAEHGSQ